MLLTMELRRFLTNIHGNLEGILFVDTGAVKVNHRRWAGDTGRNTATLSGIGTGLQWSGERQTTVKLFYAESIGHDTSITETGDQKILWCELAKYF